MGRSVEEDFQLFLTFFFLAFAEAITFGIGATRYDLLCRLCLHTYLPTVLVVFIIREAAATRVCTP